MSKIRLSFEEKGTVGDGSALRREVVIRAGVDEIEAGEVEAILAELRVAAKKQIDEWDDNVRDAHYKMVRRSMIAQMLQSIVDGDTEEGQLLDVIVENTSKVFDKDEMQTIEREINFALQLARAKNQMREEEGVPVQIQGFRVEGQGGYGRRKRPQ